MTALDTIPQTFVLASPETVPLAFDVTNFLVTGESIQAIVFTVSDLNNGRAQPSMLSGSPDISGAVVTQVVKGAIGGHHYALVGTVTISTSKILSFRTTLIADF